MTSALLEFAGCPLFAALEAPDGFVTFILPFLPAVGGVLVSLVLEAVAVWSGRSAQANWWFAMAFAAIAVFLLIWDSWSGGVPMVALADAPDAEGLRLRLSVVAFGVVTVVTVLGMAYAGVRLIVDSMPVVGVFPGVLRLVPVVAIPVVLAWHVLGAVRVFEGVSFRLFL